MGKLHDQMKRDLELKHYSPKTRSCYLASVKSFALHFHRSPAEMSDEEIRQYLHYLIEEKKASQAVISQTYSALKFFYETTLRRDWNGFRIPRSKMAKRLPVVLSQQEVEAIFSATRNLKHRAIFMTIYSAGLRVSEALHLKVSDIDSQRMAIRVEQGKGAKDRYTLLAQRTLEVLRDYWRAYRPQGRRLP
jgi:integrase/recombinase XerD